MKVKTSLFITLKHVVNCMSVWQEAMVDILCDSALMAQIHPAHVNLSYGGMERQIHWGWVSPATPDIINTNKEFGP